MIRHLKVAGRAVVEILAMVVGFILSFVIGGIIVVTASGSWVNL